MFTKLYLKQGKYAKSVCNTSLSTLKGFRCFQQCTHHTCQETTISLRQVTRRTRVPQIPSTIFHVNKVIYTVDYYSAPPCRFEVH